MDNLSFCLANLIRFETTVLEQPWEWTIEIPAESNRVVFCIFSYGSGIVKIGGEIYELERGACVRGCSGIRCNFQMKGEGNYKVSFIEIQTSSEIFDFLTRSLPDYKHVDEMVFIETLWNRFETAMKNPESIQIAEAWMAAFIHEMIRKMSAGSAKRHSEKIAQLCDKIKAFPERFDDIELMAKAFHYSHNQFIRIFSEEIGLSPKAFVLDEKMRKASNLLLSGKLTVSEIAEKLGYRDIYYFCRQFKKHHGDPPMKWRQKRCAK